MVICGIVVHCGISESYTLFWPLGGADDAGVDLFENIQWNLVQFVQMFYKKTPTCVMHGDGGVIANGTD